ncbi:hypothetical protein F5B17DRAFT_425115 [Nemania serpens]|nr:hypothetical protein F5B17DRAFT_425115 [Nemania serpens]
MGESLRSILCRQPWNYDSEGQCKIKFNEDGSGELVCRREIPIFIAAQIQWRVLSDASLLDQSVTKDQDDGIQRPLEVEITLTRNRSPWVSAKPKINEHLLSEEAFLPKTYRVRLETGVFIAPRDLSSREATSESVPKYAYRLTFDKSPYPPREQWKDTTGAPDAIKFWEWTEFVSGRMSS